MNPTKSRLTTTRVKRRKIALYLTSPNYRNHGGNISNLSIRANIDRCISLLRYTAVLSLDKKQAASHKPMRCCLKLFTFFLFDAENDPKQSRDHLWTFNNNNFHYVASFRYLIICTERILVTAIPNKSRAALSYLFEQTTSAAPWVISRTASLPVTSLLTPRGKAFVSSVSSSGYFTPLQCPILTHSP